MADPELLPESRRRAERAGQRSRRRRRVAVFGAAFSAAALIVGALFATDVIALPGDGETTSRVAVRRVEVTTTTKPPRRPIAALRRDLAGDDPLRLWIAGDSLAGSVGPALGEVTAGLGVVQPQYDSRVSSGLLNPNFFNWPKQATDQLKALDPEVVVFIIGTNDAAAWDKSKTEDYRARTEAMMRELAGTDREVYWVGPPVLRDSSNERGAQAVTLIARTAAARVPRVTFVDAHTLFADADGDYQQSFDDESGTRRVMRAGDGIHYSADGAEYLERVPLQAHRRRLAAPGPGRPRQSEEGAGDQGVDPGRRHIPELGQRLGVILGILGHQPPEFGHEYDHPSQFHHEFHGAARDIVDHHHDHDRHPTAAARHLTRRSMGALERSVGILSAHDRHPCRRRRGR